MFKANFKGNIQLNVNSFIYPARPNVSVLSNLELNIQAGIRVLTTHNIYIFDLYFRTKYCSSWCVSNI